jgi:hypothetical protein
VLLREKARAVVVDVPSPRVRGEGIAGCSAYSVG